MCNHCDHGRHDAALTLLSTDPIAGRLKTVRAFISYSKRDSEFARRFIADLSTLGFEFDNPNPQPGHDFEEQIRQALEDTDYLFVLVSSESANAKWVMTEVDTALAKDTIRIVPVIVDHSAKYLI